MLLAKLGFPIANPIIKVNPHLSGGSKQVDVVWHEDVLAHQPRGSVRPDRAQQVMNLGRSEPRLTVFCAYREEDDSRTIGNY